MHWLLDPTVARVFYGGIITIAGALAWLSNETPLRQAALWLGIDWIVDNTLFASLGSAREVVPGSAFMALIIFNLWVLARRSRNYTLWQILGLYVVSAAVDAGVLFGDWSGLTSGWQTSIFYRCVLASLFVGRMLLLGGRSVAFIRARAASGLRGAHSGVGAR